MQDRRYFARLLRRTFRAFLRRRTHEPKRNQHNLRRCNATSSEKEKNCASTHCTQKLLKIGNVLAWVQGVRLFKDILTCKVHVKNNLDLEIQNSIPTENRRLAPILLACAQRLALPASGERQPTKRNQAFRLNNLQKAERTHLSGARCVRRFL